MSSWTYHQDKPQTLEQIWQVTEQEMQREQTTHLTAQQLYQEETLKGKEDLRNKIVIKK
jgi:hypothetical protein